MTFSDRVIEIVYRDFLVIVYCDSRYNRKIFTIDRIGCLQSPVYNDIIVNRIIIHIASGVYSGRRERCKYLWWKP